MLHTHRDCGFTEESISYSLKNGKNLGAQGRLLTFDGFLSRPVQTGARSPLALWGRTYNRKNRKLLV